MLQQHQTPLVANDAGAPFTFPREWILDRDELGRNLRRSHLTRSQKAVMRTIVKAVPLGSDSALVSVSRIARAVKIEERQVRNVLRKLEDANWLRTERPKDWKPGHKCPSRYFPQAGADRCRDGRRREWKIARDGGSDTPICAGKELLEPSPSRRGAIGEKRDKDRVVSADADSAPLGGSQESDRHREKKPLAVQTGDRVCDVQGAEQQSSAATSEPRPRRGQAASLSEFLGTAASVPDQATLSRSDDDPAADAGHEQAKADAEPPPLTDAVCMAWFDMSLAKAVRLGLVNTEWEGA
jgi:hypothetical protein